MNSEHDGFNPTTRHGCEIGGRMISQVERAEVGVELASDTFTLQPSTDSGRGN